MYLHAWFLNYVTVQAIIVENYLGDNYFWENTLNKFGYQSDTNLSENF